MVFLCLRQQQPPNQVVQGKHKLLVYTFNNVNSMNVIEGLIYVTSAGIFYEYNLVIFVLSSCLPGFLSIS